MSNAKCGTNQIKFSKHNPLGGFIGRSLESLLTDYIQQIAQINSVFCSQALFPLSGFEAKAREMSRTEASPQTECISAGVLPSTRTRKVLPVPEG